MANFDKPSIPTPAFTPQPVIGGGGGGGGDLPITTELLKGDGEGGAVGATPDVDYQTPLVAGVDYQTPLEAGVNYQTPLTFMTPPTSVNPVATQADIPDVTVPQTTELLKGNGEGGIGAASSGTDYQPPTLILNATPTTATQGSVGQIAVHSSDVYVCTSASGGTYTWVKISGGGGGSTGTIATTTSVLKGDNDGNAIAAIAGTDYQAPLSFMSTPTVANPVATQSDLPSIPTVPTVASTTNLLKGDGSGNAIQATPGTDYQAPLSFTSAPTAQNPVVTEAEMANRKQVDSTTSGNISATVNCGEVYIADPQYARSSVAFTLGTPKSAGYVSEWHVGFKAASGCQVTITPPTGKTVVWKGGTPTWASGSWYEIDFMMAGSYIFAVVSETAM